MKISGISFKGYLESNTAKYPDSLVIDALNEARPYLKQIGTSMPDSRHLLVTVTEDACDTFVRAYDYDRKKDKKVLLAEGNEHTITQYGLDFVEKVFRGLKKNNEKEFKNISGDFVTKLSNVMWEQHPIGPFCSPDDGTWL